MEYQQTALAPSYSYVTLYNYKNIDLQDYIIVMFICFLQGFLSSALILNLSTFIKIL